MMKKVSRWALMQPYSMQHTISQTLPHTWCAGIDMVTTRDMDMRRNETETGNTFSREYYTSYSSYKPHQTLNPFNSQKKLQIWNGSTLHATYNQINVNPDSKNVSPKTINIITKHSRKYRESSDYDARDIRRLKFAMFTPWRECLGIVLMSIDYMGELDWLSAVEEYAITLHMSEEVGILQHGNLCHFVPLKVFLTYNKIQVRETLS